MVNLESQLQSSVLGGITNPNYAKKSCEKCFVDRYLIFWIKYIQLFSWWGCHDWAASNIFLTKNMWPDSQFSIFSFLETYICIYFFMSVKKSWTMSFLSRKEFLPFVVITFLPHFFLRWLSIWSSTRCDIDRSFIMSIISSSVSESIYFTSSAQGLL